jgi:hypothetical protein
MGGKDLVTAPTRTDPAGATDVGCTFCGARRSQVPKLIAGPRDIFLCDACVRRCVEALDRDDGDGAAAEAAAETDPLSLARRLVLGELVSLPRPLAFHTSRLLINAALVLADSNADAIRLAADSAASIGDVAGAAQALGRLPHAQRTARDTLKQAMFLEAAGAARDAVSVLDAVDVDALDLDSRVMMPLYRAMLRLSAGVADEFEARTLEASAAGVRADVERLELDEAALRTVDREILLVKARAALVANDREGARLALRQLVLRDDDHAVAWALLHDVHLEYGDEGQARDAAAQVLKHAHPDSALGQRFSRLYPPAPSADGPPAG